ncbi:hypothetical protein DSO57_1030492 [Entomophthora muscae]|uniref:Uncharacterized protein n=1 Tax=Entomophthora muscae TaxID=34485 RepID=A0ACC2T154_9FUNG|nr:hypothetical protein DSO57_1030492 [Entomophthora muscae]
MKFVIVALAASLVSSRISGLSKASRYEARQTLNTNALPPDTNDLITPGNKAVVILDEDEGYQEVQLCDSSVPDCSRPSNQNRGVRRDVVRNPARNMREFQPNGAYRPLACDPSRDPNCYAVREPPGQLQFMPQPKQRAPQAPQRPFQPAQNPEQQAWRQTHPRSMARPI